MPAEAAIPDDNAIMAMFDEENIQKMMAEGEAKRKLQKAEEEATKLTFAVGEQRATLWRGNQAQLTSGDWRRSAFAAFTYEGKTYGFKPISYQHYPVKPLALDMVDKALGLGATSSVLPVYLLVDDGTETYEIALFLEGFVAPVPLHTISDEAAENYIERHKVAVYHVERRETMGAVPIQSVLRTFDDDSLAKVSVASVQRLGLLAIFGRVDDINAGDISLRASGDRFELVLTDLKKSFGGEITHMSMPKPDHRSASEMLKSLHPSVFADAKHVMRAESADAGDVADWVPWERRPLQKSVCELILSWTAEQIDAALDAGPRASAQWAAMSASNAEGLRVRGIADQGAAWTAAQKQKTIALQERLRGGERPSLLEVARALD